MTDINKIDFKKAEENILYRDIQFDYLVLEDNEIKTFDDIYEESEELIDYPMSIGELEALGYPYIGSSYYSEDGDIIFNFDVDDDEVWEEIDICKLSDDGEFNTKDCLTVINIAHSQVYGGWEYHLAFGFNKSGEDTTDYTIWHGESTTYGDWWAEFIEFFNAHKKETKSIVIHIADGTVWIDFLDFKVI